MKKTAKFSAVILSIVLAFSLGACAEKTLQTTDPQTYTIQYADETGIHSISVQSGSLYSISPIPEKHGYEFLGLFDAETGGTQYVNSGGSSLAAFSDNKNIVLYPQFKAKEYTLILDYQGAEVTGSRSLQVEYNSLINELPLNLTLENKNFTGWYTEPNRGGTQVADRDGVIPAKNIVDESIFDLSDPKGYIYLYAGFKGQEYAVTFYFTESGAPEEIPVEHGTPIQDVQLETRVDGKAVIVWSKKRNDTNKEEIFTGKVTSEMILYAAEFAPVLDFDSNGGNKIKSIIARAGDAIHLPTPVRENYKFVGWQDTSGKTFVASTMPADSVKLSAKWQAKLLFDTNGGTDVQEISEPQGTRITLPATEKDGFMFAGWYTANGEQYTATAMPNVSVKLYAKYWKVEKKTIVIVEASRYEQCGNTSPSIRESCNILDLTDLYNAGVRKIKIKVHFISWVEGWLNNSVSMAWYSNEYASDAYEIWRYSETHALTSTKATFDGKKELNLNNPKMYICKWSGRGGGRVSDFYVEIEYPDTGTLY